MPLKTFVIDEKRSKDISVLTGVWKKLISVLMDDFEGFKTSVEEITADVVEGARELDSGDVTDVTELLQSHYRTLPDEGLILMDEK